MMVCSLLCFNSVICVCARLVLKDVRDVMDRRHLRRAYLSGPLYFTLPGEGTLVNTSNS